MFASPRGHLVDHNVLAACSCKIIKPILSGRDQSGGVYGGSSMAKGQSGRVFAVQENEFLSLEGRCGRG